MSVSDRHALLVGTWALLLPLHSVAPQQHTNRGLTQMIDSVAQRWLQAGLVAGMSVALVRGTDVLLARGYGFADLENRVPATEHTVYRIGSITKQFTAAAILQLAEQRKLRLEDDIGRYLPGYDTHGHTISIRELLNHTSGIRDFTELAAFQARERLDISAESLLAIFEHEPLDFPPGTGFHYNNSAFYLLGLIIQKVSGQAYGEYLREHVLLPLGLRESYSCDDSPVIPRRAHGYRVNKGKLENAAYLSMLPPLAGGKLCSTVLDLATWTRALAEGRLISRASYVQMTTPGRLRDGRVLGYGYGLFLSILAGHPEIVHGGEINGFSAHKSFYPNDSLTVVVLTNTEGEFGYSGRIARAIVRRALDLEPELLRAQPLSPAEGARFVGLYRAGTLNLTITVNQRKLRVSEPFPGLCLCQGADVFVSRNSPEVRLLFSGRGSRAVHLVLEFAGQQVFYLTRSQ